MKKKISMAVIICLYCLRPFAQDSTDVMQLLEQDSKKVDYTYATFKSTRLISGHSVENLGKGVLDFRILHRFAPVNRGLYDFFGFDYASMRMGFDYGFCKNFMAGIGHSTWQKTYDAFFKIKLLRQSTGAIRMPVSLSYIPTIAIRTEKAKLDTSMNRILPGFNDRTSYTHQLIIGRKFSNKFSLQLMPIYISHHNNIDSINTYTKDKGNILKGQKRKSTVALGAGGRLKVSKRVSVNLEYYYQLPDSKPSNRYNSVSFGVDIETGGHVFQLHFTNSNGMTEKSFISDTDDKWKNGAIRFGFNLSRVFHTGKH